MRDSLTILVSIISLAMGLAGLTAPANAQGPVQSKLIETDGVALITQDLALEGEVTPGDAPGFPVQINRSGSYRLASNLTVPNAISNVIEIAADDVTLDLNGFSILGPNVCSAEPGEPVVCSANGEGVGVFSNSQNITVVNGTVRGMGSHGIAINSGSNRIEAVHVLSNGGDGIFLDRNNNEFTSNLPSTISGNTVRFNRGAGINTFASTVTRNAVAQNNRAGIIAGGSSTVSNNVVRFSQSGGITAGTGSTVIGNTAVRNGSLGINANDGCVVMNNTSSFNGSGITVGDGCTIRGNAASSNEASGIFLAGDGVTVSGNTASFNGGDGVTNGLGGPGDGSTVIGNTVHGNDGVGLRLSDNTGYANNVATDNGLGNVIGGVEIGTNLCGTDTLCP